MSAAVAANGKAPLIEEYVMLLREYTYKFNALADRAHVLSESAKASLSSDAATKRLAMVDTDALKHLFKTLRPPALQLARQVSQTIERAKVEELNQLEMKLRLAEFESALYRADKLVSLT